jgi:hypothetical protein
MKPKQNECGVCFPIMHRTKVPAHSVPFYVTMCHRVREQLFLYMDVNVSVLLHYILLMQTSIFDVQVEPRVWL